MALEVEIKSPLRGERDAGRVRKMLLEMGAVFSERVIHHDIYFRHPCRDIIERDEAIRLRMEERYMGDRKIGVRFFLTHKGPRVDARTKTRFEEEVAVDDFDSARRFMKEMGFEPAFEVVKEREFYRLGDVAFSIDHVPGLGWFVEAEKKVEARVDDGSVGGVTEYMEKAVSDLSNLLTSLGLERWERRSYLELLLEKKEKENRQRKRWEKKDEKK